MFICAYQQQMKSILNWGSTTVRGWVVNNKKRRLLALYEKGKYTDMAKLFKGEKDYVAVTFDKFPFLYYIISQGNKEAVSAFVKNVPFKDYLLFQENNPLKCNPLIFTYLEGKTEIAELLENDGFSLGFANSEGQNILHMAAIYRRKEAFMEGIKKKVNIDQPDIYGNTPLHYCCRAGELQMIEALLAGKAKKTANQLHLYPIHMAIQSTKIGSIQLLKNDLWNKYPLFHPIHSAARVGALQIMQQMLKKQVTLINQRDYKSLTPLHHAVATQNHESITFLLQQKGLVINLADQLGNTPLHIAFMRDDLESVKLLVDAKADLDKLNDNHLAPVDLGLDSHSSETKSYLKSIMHKSKRLKQWGMRM